MEVSGQLHAPAVSSPTLIKCSSFASPPYFIITFPYLGVSFPHFHPNTPSYGLDCWLTLPGGGDGGSFSPPPHGVQSGPAAYVASQKIGTWAPSPGVNWQQRDADHTPPSSADAKNALSFIALRQYIFKACCLVK